MEYVAVTYRSRAQTVRFYEYLAGLGVRGEIINTPKEAGVGCGLSVKVSPSVLTIARRAARSFNGGSFAGFFLVRTVYGKRTVRVI